MEINNRKILDIARNRDWGLYIFFSVDLEGATAYKVEARAQKEKGDEDWCTVFETFYAEFPEQFFNEYMPFARSTDTLDTSSLIRPCIWKLAGDEILFYAPLVDSRHVLEHVRSFGQVIILYNERLQEARKSVRCKGTMWIGGVPNNNRIVLTQNSVDFIGSSIDCGFRLTKFSSPRRLVVSLDLLWMFAESFLACLKTTVYRAIQFKYHGEHDLKGVFSGKRYPVFWYDLYHSGECIEEQWLSQQPYCGVEAIVAFCKKVAARVKEDDFIRPFIVDDPANLFVDIPLGFDQKRRDIPAYNEQSQNTLLAKREKQEVPVSDVLPDDVFLFSAFGQFSDYAEQQNGQEEHMEAIKKTVKKVAKKSVKKDVKKTSKKAIKKQ